MFYEASAPGSLMLLGEHAVLQGESALVCAVDKRIHVKLTPREDNKIMIQSVLGRIESRVQNIIVLPPFQFVLTVLKEFQQQLPCGCDVEIVSEFSDQIGLGSSAAVTVAVLSVVNEWLELSFSLSDLARKAQSIIQKVQGIGSGADAAASVFGGIVFFSAEPFSIEKLPHHYPLTVLYSGYKTPTVEVIAKVCESFRSHPLLFKTICRAIGECSRIGREAILREDWLQLGNVMNTQQGLMDALGVNSERLQSLVTALREHKTILGAKISGSGLGDCVVGLGKVSEDFLRDNGRVRVDISEEGLQSSYAAATQGCQVSTLNIESRFNV